MKTRHLLTSAVVAASLASLIGWQTQASPQRDSRRFTVDAAWPKALPNNWLVGQVAGIALTAQFHQLHARQQQRQAVVRAPGNPRRSDCCNLAPAVLVFDREGTLLKAWGGPADPDFLTTRCVPAAGCEWPTNEHGIYVDHMDYVYIAGNGAGTRQLVTAFNGALGLTNFQWGVLFKKVMATDEWKQFMEQGAFNQTMTQEVILPPSGVLAR